MDFCFYKVCTLGVVLWVLLTFLYVLPCFSSETCFDSDHISLIASGYIEPEKNLSNSIWEFHASKMFAVF